MQSITGDGGWDETVTSMRYPVALILLGMQNEINELVPWDGIDENTWRNRLKAADSCLDELDRLKQMQDHLAEDSKCGEATSRDGCPVGI